VPCPPARDAPPKAFGSPERRVLPPWNFGKTQPGPTHAIHHELLTSSLPVKHFAHQNFIVLAKKTGARHFTAKTSGKNLGKIAGNHRIHDEITHKLQTCRAQTYRG
jgi:hypothetical protein